MKKIILCFIFIFVINFGFTKYDSPKKFINIKKNINTTNTKSKSSIKIVPKDTGEYLIFSKDFNKIKTEKINYQNIGNNFLKIKPTQKELQELLNQKIRLQKNYIYQKTAISNDNLVNLQRSLFNTGQKINGVNGISGADIEIENTWKLFSGLNSSITIAIIDDGIGYMHEEIKNSMRDGTNCLDEKGQYLGGCKHGYDFENNDKDPLSSTNSHGTHIAGIIGAQINNNNGIAGISNNLKIMAIKAGNEYLTTEKIIKAIYFAKYNGIKVINASFGSRGLDQTTNLESNFDYLLYQAIKDFGDSGGIFVTSAGNSGINHDSGNISDKFYPSDFSQNTVFSNGEQISGLNNIISVGASDQNDNLATFSDYGQNSVHILAPGKKIISSVISGENIYFQDFNTITNISGFITGTILGINNWGLMNLWDGDNAIRTDKNAPSYSNNTNTFFQLPKINTNNKKGLKLEFWGWCHSENSPSNRTDFVQIMGSSDGINFQEIGKFDYASDELYSPLTIWGKRGYQGYIDYDISNFSGNDFYLKFNWITDESDNNYVGCAIDDVSVVGYDGGGNNTYEFMDGTSMSAPYVSAIAGLGFLIGQTSDYNTIKNSIINYGDEILGAKDKTISGKRLNSYKSLSSLLRPVISNLKISSNSKQINNSFTNVGIINFNWDTTNFSGEFRYIISGGNQIISGTTISNSMSGIDLNNNGLFQVQIYGINNLGLTGNTLSGNFVFDNTKPLTPIIKTPKHMETVYNNSVSVQWNKSIDNMTTTPIYQILVEKNSIQIYSGTLANTGIELTNLENGMYQVYLTSIDGQQNVSSTYVSSFIINNNHKYISLNNGNIINSNNKNNLEFSINGFEYETGSYLYLIKDEKGNNITGIVDLTGNNSYSIDSINLSEFNDGNIISEFVSTISGNNILYLTSMNIKDTIISGCNQDVNYSGINVFINYGCIEQVSYEIYINNILYNNGVISGFDQKIFSGNIGNNTIRIIYQDIAQNIVEINKDINIENKIIENNIIQLEFTGNTNENIQYSGNNEAEIQTQTGSNTNQISETIINNNQTNNSVSSQSNSNDLNSIETTNQSNNPNNSVGTIVSQPIIITNFSSSGGGGGGGGAGGGINIFPNYQKQTQILIVSKQEKIQQNIKNKLVDNKKIIEKQTKIKKALIKLNMLIETKLKKSNHSNYNKKVIKNNAINLYKAILKNDKNILKYYKIIYSFLTSK